MSAASFRAVARAMGNGFAEVIALALILALVALLVTVALVLFIRDCFKREPAHLGERRGGRLV